MFVCGRDSKKKAVEEIQKPGYIREVRKTGFQAWHNGHRRARSSGLSIL